MVSVIITAGGSSSRFKDKNKLLYKINGKPVISYSVELFNSLDYAQEIIISANKSIISELYEMFSGYSKVRIVEGGATRQESVFKALKTCTSIDFVIIHDGARPFIDEDTVNKCFEKAKETGAAITAVKTIDTIKIVNSDGYIVSTPDRNTLYNAQTPQIFKYDMIFRLHQKYQNESYTDDSLLCEKDNISVAVVEGKYSNLKITTLEDVERFNKDM